MDVTNSSIETTWHYWERKVIEMATVTSMKSNTPDISRDSLLTLGREAREAAKSLALTSGEARAQAIRAIAKEVTRRASEILEANAGDMSAAKESGLSTAKLDRLSLDEKRLEGFASALEEIASLPDPLRVLASWERPNGLQVERVATPLGVIGMIYESRPGVTLDAACLCIKSGNGAILRGGSESFHSNHALHQCVVTGLERAGLPGAAVALVPTRERGVVSEMLAGLDGCIDVIVPRGGRSLVELVWDEARVPVFGHLEGVCHVYVDKSARLDMACEIVVNSKLRRTGICGAAETLLVDSGCSQEYVGALALALHEHGCEIRGDNRARQIHPDMKAATVEDWSKEYLDKIITLGVVDGVEGAIEHIGAYGSGHTESIISEDADAVAQFFRNVDSAILLHNASTQFADGGELGMGAEIGIATGKFHARGPVGAEQLVGWKYLVRGSGQLRP